MIRFKFVFWFSVTIAATVWCLVVAYWHLSVLAVILGLAACYAGRIVGAIFNIQVMTNESLENAYRIQDKRLKEMRDEIRQLEDAKPQPESGATIISVGFQSTPTGDEYLRKHWSERRK